MSEISLSKIEKSYGAKTVLDGITIDINRGERIGLIGRNGAGKTTLFKIITGDENADLGVINRKKGMKFGYLEQISGIDEWYTVAELLNEPFIHIHRVGKELTDLEEEMSQASDSELTTLLDVYGKVQSRYENMGGYETDELINSVCRGLKIDQKLKDRDFGNLSGGEKTIVMLARILLDKPDVLLLDEPTNHLDIESVEWLEDFLKSYDGGVIIISHDRYFLDRSITKIAELEDGKIYITKGNYSTHLQEKEKRRIHRERLYKEQQKEIKHLEESIERTLRVAKSSGNPALLRKADVMKAKLERMDRLPRPTANRKMNISFNPHAKTGKIVTRISGLKKSFGEQLLFDNAEVLLSGNERIAIIGRNGSGKTTLIKLILNEIEADEGEVYTGPGVKAAYLDQDIVFDNPGRSMLDTLKNSFSMNENEARRLLAKFLFLNEEVYKDTGTLSGGEKTRFKLAMLMTQNVNTLILDEPTNHLDLESREMLEEAVINFGGTLVFISHDRYFIDKMAERVVELKEKQLHSYEGNYAFYKEKVNQKKEELKVLSSPKRKRKDYRNLSQVAEKKRKKRIDELELIIQELEEQISIQDEEIVSLGSDFDKMEKVLTKKSEIEHKLEVVYEEWSELEN